MLHLLKKLIRHERGVALIEFVLVFPFLFLLVFGSIELTRYIIINQKVDKAAYVLTDMVGQLLPATTTNADPEIKETAIQDILNQYNRLMGTYGSDANEAVIFTSVVHHNGQNLERWQRTGGGTLSSGVTSIVTGGAPTNFNRAIGDACPPVPFNADTLSRMTGVTENENIIVGEVFYQYKPIVSSLLGVTSESTSHVGHFSIAPRLLSRRIFLHPRNGDLIDLPPSTPVPPPPASDLCP